jgi:hypothetical protein
MLLVFMLLGVAVVVCPAVPCVTLASPQSSSRRLPTSAALSHSYAALNALTAGRTGRSARMG